MIKLLSTLAIALFSMACVASEPEAIDSAASWLDVVDSGKYAESWNQASPYFQNQLSSEQWVQALSDVRAPLGALLSRRVKDSTDHSSLPGAPEGEYVVITLETSFEQKVSAVETVTVSKSGSEWKVVGYFIK